jgi:hypothetical protein
MIRVGAKEVSMVTRKPKRTAKTKRAAKTTRTARSVGAAKKTRRSKVVKKAKSTRAGKRLRVGAKKSAATVLSRHGYNPQTGSPTGEAVGDLERLEQLTAGFMAQGMSARDARERARATMRNSLHGD